jgi:tetratricopeptide (TPR) repeat protein
MGGARRRWRAAACAVAVAIACSVALSAFGQSDSEARLLFDEATRAFNAGLAAPPEEKAGHFRTALAAYETLVQHKGIRSGALYFNIGNCYFHLDEIGEAILNYRRAERIMPGHRELQANLDAALARRKDHIIPREKLFWGLPVSAIGRDIRDWLVRLPAKLPVLMAAFTLIWVTLGLKLVRRSTLLNAALVTFIIMSAVYAAAVAAQASSLAGDGRGVVVQETVVARTGPSTMHAESFEQPLHEGVEFRVLRRESGWIKVELPDGAHCWLPAEAAGAF